MLLARGDHYLATITGVCAAVMAGVFALTLLLYYRALAKTPASLDADSSAAKDPATHLPVESDNTIVAGHLSPPINGRGGVAYAIAYAIALLIGCVAAVAGLLYGGLGWLLLGYLVFIIGFVVARWGIRHLGISRPWTDWLAVALAVLVVGLIGFSLRERIHP